MNIADEILTLEELATRLKLSSCRQSGCDR